MKFSIITPAFTQLSYLKRCVASIADQKGVDVEHIVIDGGSTDGTVEWLMETAGQQKANNYHLAFFSEADEGMYDALNKGFDEASGDIFAWLNCDEQYLSGTLSFVRDWFVDHPEADMLSGSALLIRPGGELLAFRKAYPLRRRYLEASHLYNLSCGIFFRRRVWEQGLRFDASYRYLGDQDWVMRLLQNGVRAGCTSRFLSAFCFTGQNMSQSEKARSEESALRDRRPVWARLFRIPLNLLRWSEKVLRGAYCQRPFDYAVYPDGNTLSRQPFHIKKASSKWPGK